ncbi:MULTISPECIES: DNA phosphorothioation-associated protein 4 [unclassified Anabaena]|uniref:DNA phosphorothioation-associated protein 4 n=1 Tax=unclassified Anabaena TaxID=2619674 RepID=UPI001446731D|nr:MULTISPECIES: DNA phosphorothioation-associated protein 4 [unclassified Anabaena]MTJ08167.1 DNA phosphorothioation-associated protein 4 [Anabaena sp. UHCC 0204]MTJ53403.1 DNA phosphorothioation-associated protein 4 [Anabaena sp. UHCC 0253]
MAANRIKIAQDKAELVKSLLASKETPGPFQTYVEVMIFAAALGVKYKKSVPLGDTTKRDPSPIPQDNFASLGYDKIIKLLGIVETSDIQILASREDEYEDKRTQIFEEYANGGLEILQSELRGVVDYAAQLLVILITARDYPENNIEEEFNLSRFLK